MGETITVQDERDAFELLKEETGLEEDYATNVKKTDKRTMKVTATAGAYWTLSEYEQIDESEWFVSDFEGGDTLYLTRR